MNTPELENILRLAPRPVPPAGLKDRLIAQLALPATQPASKTPAAKLAPANWLRRWWPVLVPGAVSLVCAVSLTMQQVEIHNLKQAIQELSRDSAITGALPSPTAGTNGAAPEAGAATRTQQEVARLKELKVQLAAEVAQLEQLHAENVKLRAQLAAPPAGFLTPEETESLAKAKEKAESVTCCNNMKQLGLSVRVWALDNGDVSPPDILSMTNEMNTPKILVCPGDKAREPAKDWASYSTANCSYEYLAPATQDVEPFRVLFRCPIHGHVGLCDGSVQMRVAKDHPERLVQRNGKLYLDNGLPPPQVTPASPGSDPAPNPTP